MTSSGQQQSRFVNHDNCTGVQYGQHNVKNVTVTQPRHKKEKVIKPKKPLSNSERPPNTDQLDKICAVIEKSKVTLWKELGEKLGLSQGEVETVEADFHGSGVYEMCYQMLRIWQQRQPTPYQVRILAQALDGIGRGDLADTLAY